MEPHQLSRPSRRGRRIVSLGTMYIQTARDADGEPLWLNWMVILACWWLLSSCRNPKPLHVLGVVNRTQDASAAPVEGSFMDEGLRGSCVQEGAARGRGDSTMER